MTELWGVPGEKPGVWMANEEEREVLMEVIAAEENLPHPSKRLIAYKINGIICIQPVVEHRHGQDCNRA